MSFGFYSLFIIQTFLFSLLLLNEPTLGGITLGPRPLYLVDLMEAGELKQKLLNCQNKKVEKSQFVIGHRGAPLQFPEHTKESYVAAARMGAGILECDVAFTKDLQLVCRHSQCDLHTSTNVLLKPDLAAKCSVPFTPFNEETGTKATAKCCTSDFTLKEFKSLCGKMDGANSKAVSVAEYIKGTADYRTDLYNQCGTVMSHRESISLFKSLGVKMIPELKAPSVDMPYLGKYTQRAYAQQLVDDYKALGVPPEQFWLQSFNKADILYWLEKQPKQRKQVVYLEGRYTTPGFDPLKPSAYKQQMVQLKNKGLRVWAPPLWMLLTIDGAGKIVPSPYGLSLKELGYKIIPWTLERSPSLSLGGGWYFKSIAKAVKNDGDIYRVLDILVRELGISGIFTDWPATVTYYANCNNL